MNKNRIGGIRRRASWQLTTKSISIKGAGCKSGDGALKAVELTAGWRGYFGFCQTPSVMQRLDRWLRRRLRSVVWNQWEYTRVRFAELCKRRISKDLAAQTAGSAHGPWRLNNSPALAIALPNAYFASLGLPRLVVA